MDIVVFTDGSCIGQSSDCPYGGYGVYFPNKELEDVSEPLLLKPITNQRAELYAIYTALDKLIGKLDFNTITIYSDSEYSIKSLTKWIYKWKENGWMCSNKKPVKNKDIIEPIFNLLEKYPSKIKFIHVKSHTGNKDFVSIGNERADQLAVDGTRKGQIFIKKCAKKKLDSRIKVVTTCLSENTSSELSNKSPMEVKIVKQKIKKNKYKIKVDTILD